MGRVAAQEGSYLAAVAAHGHGTPAAPMRTRVIVKKEATGGIGAAADGNIGAFDEQLRRGTGNRGEEPVQAVFASQEFQAPGIGVQHQFVVAFGNSEKIIDRLDPDFGEGFVVHHGGKDGAKGFPQPKHLQEHGIYGTGFSPGEEPQSVGSLFRDNTGGHEKRDEFVPGKVVRGGCGVGEIQGEPPGNERWPVGRKKLGHEEPSEGGNEITGLLIRRGYTILLPVIAAVCGTILPVSRSKF